MAPDYELNIQKLIDCWLALRWADIFYNTFTATHNRHSDEVISQVILEYTGLSRNRKQVSSHIQALARISDRIPEESSRLTQHFTQQLVCATAKLSKANREDTADIDQILRQIQQATFILARRNRQVELAPTQRRRRQRSGNAQAPQNRSDKILPDGPSDSFFHEISRFTPQNDRELSLQLL